MRTRASFLVTAVPDSPTVTFSMAALKTDQFFEFGAKNGDFLHTFLNSTRFEAVMPK
jgi:hypothetical protein